MSKYELVFIPAPGISHLVSAVEMAKLLLDRDERLLITVLIMRFPNDDVAMDSYTQRVSSNACSRFSFAYLPVQESSTDSASSPTFMFDYMDSHIVHVREIVASLVENPSEPNAKLAGLVLDMFCTNFNDVAREFNVPAYVFFAAGTCALGMFYHFLSVKFEDIKEIIRGEFIVPCFSKPVPAEVLSGELVRNGNELMNKFMGYAKRLKEVEGIMINTFYELETFAIDSIRADGSCPKVYPVGPILNSGTYSKSPRQDDETMKWLDSQPENSVVFLCFGTMGGFQDAQVIEIAKALEKSGQRFLWALRKPADKGIGLSFPSEYENFGQVLPEGFIERTNGVGKLVGWAPQMMILSHKSVGGFISHCGWNSILESIWFGVPMATFPLYAEQQQNAFLLARELEIAEEIRIDYKIDLSGETVPESVGSEEIEAAIRRLMRDEAESSVRRKVNELKEKSRLALMEGGSSYMAQNLFIEDVIRNID